MWAVIIGFLTIHGVTLTMTATYETKELCEAGVREMRKEPLPEDVFGKQTELTYECRPKQPS